MRRRGGGGGGGWRGGGGGRLPLAVTICSIFHVNFQMVKCCMSNLRNGPCLVNDIFSHVGGLLVACQFKEIAVFLLFIFFIA